MPTVRLQSSDGEIFNTDANTIKCSETIKTMFDDCRIGDEDDVLVPVQNVRADILQKVLEWANHHKDEAQKAGDGVDTKQKRTDDISEWDANFLKVDQGMLFDLILAANYLDVRGLLDVTCKKVASMIKGKNPDQIRKTFNIINDFGEEEGEEEGMKKSEES
ncbi:S-phase kinase-associated protein 1-like [Bradysia coprophila]|uniref:S-phase kinase-associated protein 1-like n=1 Tax=Bradysia coprophila TaxID=38358 RepID=UPI00187D8ABB|nr:S-phase kinase-associated protein 1-like [Bradysia coprophila]XP_037039829.1 S-phase kinase-associated protein 1-like [Bradysia coprophila]XP_037039830.1 S-phase kinase-associated protein 1-like [Bradysia coprophila]